MESISIGWSNLAIFQQRTGKWCQLPIHTFSKGSHVAVIGACGMGKTALARALCGFGLPDSQRGDVLFAGLPMTEVTESEIARTIAYVPPQANTALSGIGQTLESEMALTLQFLGATGDQASKHISKWADFLGIQTLLLREPLSLSGGELVLAAMAIALVKDPQIIVFDTSYDFLHPDTRSTLGRVTSELSRKGCIVIETFPRIPDIPERFDYCIFLLQSEAIVGPYRDIRDRACGEHFLDKSQPAVVKNIGHSLESISYNRSNSQTPLSERKVLKVTDVIFWYHKNGFQFGPTSLEVYRGEIVSLVGPNGAGKTTLMKLIACLLESKSGTVGIATGETNVWEFPPPPRNRHRWARYALYGFQNPDDQLYLPTVREELASVAHNTTKPVLSSTIESMANDFGLSAYLADSPLDLPGPMRRLITIAAAFLAHPPVLLLDEPTAGLDIQQIAALTIALRSYTQSGGTCLFVSHNANFIACTADRSIELSGGQLYRLESLPPKRQRP